MNMEKKNEKVVMPAKIPNLDSSTQERIAQGVDKTRNAVGIAGIEAEVDLTRWRKHSIKMIRWKSLEVPEEMQKRTV